MSRVSGRPYFVYVLWSEVGRRFYTGVSEDPGQRLSQHNEWQSRWTSRYRPWTLVFEELFPSYTAARKRELLLKRQKGGEGFYKLTGLDPSRFRSGSWGS